MFLFAWLILSIIPAVVASNKGRSAIGYFFLSLLSSPLIGLIIVLLISPIEKNIEKKQIDSGTMKRCPFCAEMIKSEAIVCRYCGKELPKEQIEDHNPSQETEPDEEAPDFCYYCGANNPSKLKICPKCGKFL